MQKSVVVEINNSFSKVTGLNSSQSSKLRKILSYKDPNASYFNRFARPTYLIDKAGNFPTGLFKRVLSFLLLSKIEHIITDLRKMPNRSAKALNAALAHTPYADQLKAVDAALMRRRGIISMPTGTGKSVVIAMIIAKLKVRTLIVVPTVELKNQLIADLVSVFGHTHDIQVYNIASAALKNKTDFDCLIVDEGHHSAAKAYRDLNKKAWKGIYWRFFLTATPFRNEDHEQLLFEGIAGQLIYKLSIKASIDRGYIAPVEAYYYELPKKEVEGYTWAQVYSELVVNNQERNELIAWLLLNLNAQKAPTLCLVKEIKHGQLLSELTGLPFVSGADEESRSYIEDFKAGRITALIGTTGVIGEGVDTKPAEYVIIAGLGKAKSAFMQQVGRVVRRYPGKESAKVILFKDKSHKFTVSHFNAQKKILVDEYGIEVVKLS